MALTKLQKSARRKQARLKSLFGLEFDVVNMTPSELKQFTNRNNFRYMKNSEGYVFDRREVNFVKELINEGNQRLKAEEKRLTGRMTNAKRSTLKYSEFGLFEPKKVNLNRAKKGDLNTIIEYAQKLGTREFFDKKYNQYHQNFMQALDTVSNGGASDVIAAVRNMGADEFMKLYYTTNEIFDINWLYDPMLLISGVISSDEMDIDMRVARIRDFLIKKGYMSDT